MIENIKKISIVGCGPGDKNFITGIGLSRINNSRVLIGSKRLLEMFPELLVEKLNIGNDYNALAVKIVEMKGNRIVILVSGDPGFFSLSKLLIRKIGITNCEVIPGISSVQLAFARIGESWNDAKFISLHGRNEELPELVNIVEQNNKVAILTDEINSPARIAEILKQKGLTDIKAFIFENISFENECIHDLDIESMCNVHVTGMNVVILLK